MWQGGIKMASLNVTDVIKELDISKSYLYKLIDKENILIPRSDTGRYFWDENKHTSLSSPWKKMLFKAVPEVQWRKYFMCNNIMLNYCN